MYMGYAVELSFEIRTSGLGYTQQISAINTKAREYGCSSHYSMHEIEGVGRKTVRNENITVVIFDSDPEIDENMLLFVKDIRNKNLGYIDCIYRDDISCNLLYASPKYLRRLDKKSSLENRRLIKNSDDTIIPKIKKAMKVN
mgnify:FL=1|tara:strand:- start:6121 stop:6546 length:426 start_codon:yes stop_codon:yes gene_type:complete